jgi:environmental stress-induced protein Ves
MTRHLTRKDYAEMAWANGRGTTIEMLRETAEDGGILWRFSMATVAEDGAFSLFPDIERNLTVIDGPGFDLLGNTNFRADLLCPVAFPGDMALAAHNVTGPAVDFNVMTRRHLPKPKVEVVSGGVIAPVSGAVLCIFALGKAQFGDYILTHHDLLVAAPAAVLTGAPCIAVHLFTATGD